VSLRAGILAYLTVLHGVFAALAFLLLRDAPYWLLGVEALFALSLGVGVHLSRRVLQSLSFSVDATRLLREDELTSRFTPVRDPDVNALIAVYNGMVDRLREQRSRLQEQHYFFRQVVDASPAGLVVLDFDGHVVDLNPAAERLLGVAALDAKGRTLPELPSPLAGPLADVSPGGATIVSLTGPRRVKIQHGTFVDQGFSRSFFVIFELTEELRQFERAAYEKLIRVMSHEVNNTVTASNSLLQSSLAYAQDLPASSRADVQHALGIVIERTEQLRLFLRRFADVFRLPAPIKQSCALDDVVSAVVRLVSARPDAARLTWQLSAEGPMTVTIDRAQIEQVCVNVLTNAVEAAGPDGTVSVRLGTTRGRPTLVVEDNGPGLSAEAQENVFTPFFSTKPHGQGIGLTLVREILTAHGCDYALDSAPAGGARFTIVF